MNAMYSNAQWAWIGARWAEGYSLDRLAKFLDMSTEATRQNLHRRGCHYVRADKRGNKSEMYISLDERKKEFYELWDKEEIEQ